VVTPYSQVARRTIPDRSDDGSTYGRIIRVGDERRFRSTVPYYVRFRPRYPDELISRLAETAGLGPSSRVLDLGSGPGHVALPLAALVGEVVAVDVEPVMLAALAESAPPNVRTVEERAEEVDESWGSFDLATAGRSFHWFDAEVVLGRLARITPRLALLADEAGAGAAQGEVLGIARELLGEGPRERRASRFRDLLGGSPFSELTVISVEVERLWTPEDLIGFAYSTSVASPERLGALRPEFERIVRERMPAVSHDHVTAVAYLGSRPEG
jgi:SAM-dependent methyltransferase